MVFIGDDHLDDWAEDAAAELNVEPVVESGVSLTGDRTVTDVVEGDAPDIVVLSIGTADEAWLSDFEAGIRRTVSEVRAAWPDSRVVLVRPAWENEGDLETEKNAVVEQVAEDEDLVHLDAEPNAESFTKAWAEARR